ncbi:helix-turn-helix domain-containing protein, partial [Rhizobium ecuadorense]|uniref:helix-turn-helix domain-containing protein n=1 Tax=Rhizobium ecuadorense TaxID=1671795 RepID=UPI001FCD1A29
MTSTINRVSWQCGNILLILWKASMDSFDAMAVLLAVVDAGSLSAGARRLNAPLATV